MEALVWALGAGLLFAVSLVVTPIVLTNGQWAPPRALEGLCLWALYMGASLIIVGVFLTALRLLPA